MDSPANDPLPNLGAMAFALLEPLASKDEQIRYMINGTKDEYLLPDEALSNALHFCELMMRPENKQRLSTGQATAVLRLSSALDEHHGCADKYVHATLKHLVEDDAEWALLRERANLVIDSFKA